MQNPSSAPVSGPPAASAGLTLIELLVAFTILTIAGLALFSLSSRSIAGNIRTEDQTAAATLATAKIDELRNVGFDALSNGSDTVTATGQAGGIYSRSWTVASTTLSGVSTPAKTITVSVTWQGGGEISMSSLIVKPAETTPGFVNGFPRASIKSMEQTR